ncbi:helicase associated domain-containing protein [Streptomyces sp. NBC_00046]|uniref:helicase associated domain-containing protein n=1 Tax=unclassified Streptomyces TaxID=2593676 RepID=UPI0032466152
MSAVLYDPEALLAEELPLDRAPMMALVDAMLARKDASGLRAGDCAQIALLLTGHARIVAAEVSRHVEALPKDSKLRPVAEQVLQEAEHRLSVTSQTSRPTPPRTRAHTVSTNPGYPQHTLLPVPQLHPRETTRVPRKHVEQVGTEAGLAGQQGGVDGVVVVKLGTWLDNVRKRAGKLAEQRRADLDQLGMRW